MNGPLREVRRARLEELLLEQPAPRQLNLARLLRRSPPQINQWLSGYRTITEDSARTIERNAKKPAFWLDGAEVSIDRPHPEWGAQNPPWRVAAEARPPPYNDPPMLVWGADMKNSLPPRFRVEAPDDSMAPRVRAGAILEFDSTEAPRPGDGVLVRDDAGRCYLRMFTESHPGQWVAVATNPAFQPLDSTRHGLQVIAILTGVMQRWG